MEHLPTYTDELYHHGILGQRWGVRRFQNKDGSLTRAGEQRYLKGENNNSSEESQKQGFHLTDKQKKYLKIGAAVAGTCLLAYGGYRMATANDMTKSLFYDKATGLLKKPFADKLPMGDGLADTLAVNPRATSIFANDYLVNCSKCSAAYDLRRKGFNVEACPANGPTYMDVIDKYFNNATQKHIRLNNFMGEQIPHMRSARDDETYSQLFQMCQDRMTRNPLPFRRAQDYQLDALNKTCSDFGPNARGHIALYFANGGGHSIAFENDSKGRPVFIDNQIAHLVENFRGGKDSAYFNEQLKHTLNPFAEIKVTRTDNATPNYKFLTQNNIIKNSYDPEEVFDSAYMVSMGGLALAGTSVKSLIDDRKATKQSNSAKIIAYKKEHPNTKMSDNEILKSLS